MSRRRAGAHALAHRGPFLAVLGIGVMLVLAGAFIWPVTDLIAAHDVGAIAGQQRALRLQDAREAVRGQLLTLAAGIFVAGTLWFTAQTYRLARHGQVTDRYAKAIEQLGSDKLDVRVGSLYALEHIARDSPPDHSTVMEVLATFTREHSHEPWPPDAAGAADPRAAGRRTRPDVEAAMTIIGRRNTRNDQLPIDISRAELIWVYLPGADLGRLDLYGADLTRAILRGAHLASARLEYANLADADLTGADLSNASLASANLEGANLEGANLEGANLDGADLAGAVLAKDAIPPPGWVQDPITGGLRRAPQP